MKTRSRVSALKCWFERLATFLLFAMWTSTVQAAQSVTLAWDPSVDTNVTSYVLYYGTASGSYTVLTNVGNRTLATVSNMPAATWYFVVTARDDNTGLESDPSNEVFCNIASLSGALHFGVASYSANENGGLVTIVVSRTGGSNGPVAVNYATSGGSATAGQDYTSTSGTLSWANGDATPKSFTVPILDDSNVEGNETVNVTLSNPTGGATLGTPSSAALTITDNDSCAYSFSATSASFAAAGGAGSLTVTAQTGCSWSVANPNSWITINSGGSGNGNGTVNYTVAANTGTSTRAGTLTIAGQSYTITQTAPRGTLQFSLASFTVNESGPVATITVTRAAGQAGAVGVSYATGGGSATAGQDYTAGSGTLSWADGDTASKSFTVPILDDSNIERNETVNASLSNPTGGATLGTPSAAVLTITENDACAYSLSATSAAFEAAGGPGSLTVTAQAGCAWTVANPNSWITITSGSSGSGNGTMNYTVATNAGTATRTGTLTIAGQSFNITQTAPRGSLQFSQAGFTVAENGGTATITVSRIGGRSGVVSVNYTSRSGSATAGQDYTDVTGTLSWADGNTASKSFTVPILDDTSVEGNETVDLSLSNATGGATLGTPNTAVLTLTENDVCSYVLSASSAAFDAAGGVSNVTVRALSGCAWSVANPNAWITINSGSSGNGTGTVSYAVAPHTGTSPRTGTLTIGGATYTVSQTAPRGTLQFSQASFTVSESGPVATITVTRVNGQAGAVGVRYATADGLATVGQDYTAASGTLSWADGDAAPKSYTVPIINDTVVEQNETVNLSLSNPTGGATLGTPGTAVLTITENDACAYSLSAAGASFEAAGGAGSVTVTAQTGCAWTVANPNAWVTISSGSSGSGNGRVNYTVEANSGTAARAGTLTIAGNTYTINQAPPSVGTLQFSLANFTVSESGPVATITVTRTAGQAGAVGVSYATGGGSATLGQDYTAASGTLSWADGDTGSKTFSVPILDDSNVDGNETVNISLSNPTGGATLGTPNAAVLTITDNDACAYSLSAASASFAAAGGQGSLTVTAQAGCSWTVANPNSWITINSGGSGNGNGTVNYTVATNAGTATRTGTLTIAGQPFIITQTAPHGSLQFSLAGYTASESGPTATIAVTRTGGRAGTVGVSYATGGGSATTGQDYTLASGTLSWADGDTASKNFTVPILDDTSVEGNETVDLSLSNPTGGATLGTPNTAVLTITENDVCSYTLSASSAAFDAAGGVSNVTVRALNGCAWAVANPNGWITINSGSSGNGTGTVSYAVAPHTGTSLRTGLLTIAGATYTVTQTAPRGTLQFSQASFTVSESGPVATITVTRANGQAGAVGVRYAMADGLATAGQDYTAASGTLSWADGDTTPKSFTVPIINDTVVEQDETVNLSLSNATGGATLGAASTALLTIIEDDACAYSLSATSASFDAAGGAGTVAVVAQAGCAWSVANPNAWVTINSGSSGSGNGVVNYTVGANPGTSARTGTLTIAGNTYTINQAPPSPGTLQFSQINYTVDENGALATLTVTRAGGQAGAVGVDYTTSDGTAIAGQDYTAAAGTLSWADADTAPKSFTIQVANDTVFTGNRALGISLSNPTGGASLGAPNSASLLILEDDGSSGPDVETYMVAKGQQFEQAGEAVPALATNEGAYHFLSFVEPSYTGAVTNASIRNNTTQSLVPENEVFELERSFTNKSTLDSSFANSTYAFTIQTVKDGVRTPSLRLSSDAYPCTPHICYWIEAQGVEAAAPFTVNWNPFTNGTPSDFVLLQVVDGSGELAFSSPGFLEPNALNGTHDSVTIPSHALQHGQAYRGRLMFVKRTALDTNSYPGVAGISGFYKETKFRLQTLLPAPPQGRLQFSARQYFANEGAGLGTVTVIRTGGSQGSVGVNISTSDGTAKNGEDYTGISQTLILGDGVTSASFSFPLLDDVLLEGREAVRLTLGNPTGGAVLGGCTNAAFNIIDNEQTTAGVLQFSAPSYTVTEAGPAALLTVNRTGGTLGGVSVNFAAMAGSATSGADYVATNGTLVFAAGEKSKKLSIRILEDYLDEPGETFQVVLSAPTVGAALGSNHMATVTVTDNDIGGVISFSSLSYSISETVSVALITVKRSGGSASGVTVNYATVDGAALAGVDYGAAQGTLSFGWNELAKTFTIPILPDLLPEGDETLGLRLSNPTGGASLGSYSNAVFTILDDEQTLQFSSAVFTNSEAAASATITVVRSGPAIGTVTVEYYAQDSTASSAADYQGVRGMLTLGPGVSKQTFKVAITNDTVVEGPESFEVLLANPAGGAQLGGRTSATVLILDNDLGGAISFTATNFTASESIGSAVVTLGRTGGMASGVTVDFTTANDTAIAGVDYSPVSQTITFKANETTKTVLVPISRDSIDETNETLRLHLSRPTGGASLGARASAALTIQDDDVGGVIAFSAASYSVSETGGVATITVKRTGGSAGGVTVSFATMDGTATAGQDYVAIQGTMTFGSNEMTKTFTVNVVPDTIPERDETIGLRLGNPSGGAKLGAISNATLTVITDELVVAGAYKLMISSKIYGCTNSADNRSLSWVGEWTLIDLADNNFEGQGVLFNTSLGLATLMSVTGKVYAAGIVGTYATESGWSGGLNGTYSGGNSVLFGGQSSDGPCKETGSMSVTLLNPSTIGFAPARLENYSLRMNITGGSGVLATNGSYQADFSDAGYSFDFFPVPAYTPVQDGIFLYTKTAPNAATLTLREVHGSGDFLDSSVTLTYTSAAGGTYTKKAIGATGTQAGTFTLFR